MVRQTCTLASTSSKDVDASVQAEGPPHALLCVHYRGGKAHLTGLQSRLVAIREREMDRENEGKTGKRRNRQGKGGMDRKTNKKKRKERRKKRVRAAPELGKILEVLVLEYDFRRYSYSYSEGQYSYSYSEGEYSYSYSRDLVLVLSRDLVLVLILEGFSTRTRSFFQNFK